jgi:hypothetical protein
MLYLLTKVISEGADRLLFPESVALGGEKCFVVFMQKGVRAIAGLLDGDISQEMTGGT